MTRWKLYLGAVGSRHADRDAVRQWWVRAARGA